MTLELSISISFMSQQLLLLLKMTTIICSSRNQSQVCSRGQKWQKNGIGENYHASEHLMCCRCVSDDLLAVAPAAKAVVAVAVIAAAVLLAELPRPALHSTVILLALLIKFSMRLWPSADSLILWFNFVGSGKTADICSSDQFV